ncbi:MAG: riboflavin kinase [Rikenellaceae bacterium]
MFFSSKVVSGKKLGRTIGFPTANLHVDASVALPENGVYAARVVVGGQQYSAMAYIGTRPTVDLGGGVLVEVSIMDFDSDIYGSQIQVELVAFIRGEQKFDSLEQLREQIMLDKKRIVEVLGL